MSTAQVALVRGEALNPFETQAYAHLGSRHEAFGVGRRRATYGADDLAIPAVFLPAVGASRVAGALHRRTRRLLPSLDDPAHLFGFDDAVASAQILHAAETVLPVSEQAARNALMTGRPLVLTCWETIPFRYDDTRVLADRKRFVKSATAMYLAVTFRAQLALEEEGVSPDRIRVVPAGIDVDRFCPATGRLPIGGLELPQGAFVFLYVGRLIQEKGVVELTRAFAKANLPGAQLVLVGSGDQGDRVRIAAAAHGVADTVHLLPFLPYSSLPQVYAGADVVVAPSLTTPYWEEQFGMVLAEAMACGRPLVTTRSGAIPEVVEDAAILVEPYDVDALADALCALYDDAPMRDRLGTQARELAVRKYAAGVVGAMLAAAYVEVAAI